ncbi:leucine-rich repeat domain-containing protein [Legionella rowbothamii]|uniref:leucine-rich repeat domain-containing protein n=1 Tax=Legionella rowbothamii TaxID=96229 RepID=UPI001056D0C6|nr:leucine-rich repeat domain-containing protein [Legionella rowbothamii]
MKLKTFLKQIKQNNSSLETVQLSLTQNGNVKKLLAALSDETNEGCANISELDLSGSNLRDEDIVALVKALNKLPNIKTLRLDNCAITDDYTSRHLVELEYVISLSLRSNLLGQRPAFNKNLKALYLDDNPDLNVKAALLRFSTYAKKLEILSLNRCKINDNALQFLMREGSNLKTLKELHLHGNKLSSIGIDYLKGMNLLEVLDLGRNNQIGDYGVGRLQCPALRTLNIEGCNLSPHVFQSLETMTMLRKVNLSYNPALKLYEKDTELNGLEQIKRVKLNFCQLKDVNVPSLIALFPNITHLEIANNQLTHVGVEDLLTSKHLKALDVSTNSMFSILSAKSQKGPRANKTITAEKAKVEELLLSVSQAKELIRINLSSTGLPDDMLASFIPAEGSPRKLRSINGILCVELKDVLKQREEAKNIKLAAQVVGTSVDEVIEVEAKPSKSAQIKALKAQVKDLKAKLAEAQATLQGAKLSEVPHEKGRVRKQVDHLETRLSMNGMFASTATKSKKENTAPKASVVAESSFSS